MPGMGAEEIKKAIKDAVTEWLNEKFATFGRWSAYSLAALGLASFIKFILMIEGWKK